MKRSKIFMGVAALGIAAFGSFAFRSSSSSVSAFYQHPETGCTSYGTVNCIQDDAGGCNDISLPGPDKQLYLQGCQQKLRPETGF